MDTRDSRLFVQKSSQSSFRYRSAEKPTIKFSYQGGGSHVAENRAKIVETPKNNMEILLATEIKKQIINTQQQVSEVRTAH